MSSISEVPASNALRAQYYQSLSQEPDYEFERKITTVPGGTSSSPVWSPLRSEPEPVAKGTLSARELVGKLIV